MPKATSRSARVNIPNRDARRELMELIRKNQTQLTQKWMMEKPIETRPTFYKTIKAMVKDIDNMLCDEYPSEEDLDSDDEDDEDEEGSEGDEDDEGSEDDDDDDDDDDDEDEED
jgi:hypothetical protein